MNIRNNISPMMREKIRKCINLLDSEYKTLDFTIDLYKTRKRLETEKRNKPDLEDLAYNQILQGEFETSAIIVGERKLIKVFLFMYDNPETDFAEFIKLIAKVYHELRHAWQYANHLYKNEPQILNVDLNWEEYVRLPSEKDAYKFEVQQMNKHMPKIVKIFGSEVGCIYTLKKPIRDIVYSK
ncbi:hypothetical protein CR205_13060 [Alteribacter lacisalsi]|uniref:Uncharacterized protein n=1 Tax=Alteribacter lacisalsi TaxID=2045244 RepID=A0A2W0HSQ4_9BACI|nr:hypothetical protein [Alteribacter lacisalsi]PYZ96628.1 hypothetical protein CR205_13060 [Alteribacter lacisalsi]